MTYPVISYPLVFSGTIKLRVTADSTTELLTFPAGTYDGFGTDGSGDPTSGSVIDAFATMLETHSKITTAAPSWDFTLPGYPRMAWAITYASGTSGTLEWTHGTSSLATHAAALGFDVADQAFTTTITADMNHAGVWCPGPIATQDVDIQRWVSQRAYQTKSPLQTTYTTRRWGAVSRFVLVYDAVGEEWISAYARGISAFAGRSSLDTADTYNTLEDLLSAASKGCALKLWTADGVSETVRVNSFEVGDYITEWEKGARWWIVTLPLDVVAS